MQSFTRFHFCTKTALKAFNDENIHHKFPVSWTTVIRPHCDGFLVLELFEIQSARMKFVRIERYHKKAVVQFPYVFLSYQQSHMCNALLSARMWTFKFANNSTKCYFHSPVICWHWSFRHFYKCFTSAILIVRVLFQCHLWFIKGLKIMHKKEYCYSKI